MTHLLRPAITTLILFSLLTGILYPLVITGLAQVAFPAQANGSLIFRDGGVVGSALIGQEFDDPAYFWGRPSATCLTPYNGVCSGGSNDSVLNPRLAARVRARLQAIRSAGPGSGLPVPVDLVTTSASGLDPHISGAAAEFQAARVANARGLPIEQVRGLIREHTRGPVFGILGEKTVNVLEINLSLAGLQ